MLDIKDGPGSDNNTTLKYVSNNKYEENVDLVSTTIGALVMSKAIRLNMHTILYCYPLSINTLHVL